MEPTTDTPSAEAEQQINTSAAKAIDDQATGLKKMLQNPNAKSKLYTVLKALSAMKMTKEDPIPSLVLGLTQGEEGKLELLKMATDDGEVSTFLF